MKPNFLFASYGKRLTGLKANSLFGSFRKRSLKPNSGSMDEDNNDDKYDASDIVEVKRVDKFWASRGKKNLVVWTL